MTVLLLHAFFPIVTPTSHLQMPAPLPANLPASLLQTALLLGYRSSRRPEGYWDSLELLDAELEEFIAGMQTRCRLISSVHACWVCDDTSLLRRNN